VTNEIDGVDDISDFSNETIKTLDPKIANKIRNQQKKIIAQENQIRSQQAELRNLTEITVSLRYLL